MTGKKYGRLTVLSRYKNRKSKSGRTEVMWLCKCDCGNIVSLRGVSLRNGNTISCGCYRKECSSQRMHSNNTIHGFGGTRIYKIWQAMIDRCENENNKKYKNYGARGIKVCEDWHDVRKFAEWAFSNGYKDDLTIERLDNNLDYESSNCVWADRYVQNNHTSRNHMITYQGKTQTMAQWSKETGLPYSTIKSRLNKHGWSVERALSTPLCV